MIPRLAEPLVREQLARYPAVAVVGPRQCGKTTLARSLAGRYFDMESAEQRSRLDIEWQRLVAGRELVVLDEAQAAPHVFPEIRVAIDQARKRNGRFLLLGSVSPALMTQVSESLAGRLAIVELTPLLLAELTSAAARRRHWLTGGFPDGGVLVPRSYPDWQMHYLAQLAQRDLPVWGLSASIEVTQRMQRMLAASHGQTWVASRIGQSLGISHPTASSYLDYFIGAFLVRLLRPWHGNIGKRLVKSPKLYWRDCGLLHALLGAADANDLLDQPWVGASWEGYVIEQILGTLAARGLRVEPYFFRTSDQQEIDLIIEAGSRLLAVEIKLTSRPSDDDLRQLDRTANLIAADRRFLVSRTTTVAVGDRLSSVNLEWMTEQLPELLSPAPRRRS